MTVPASPPLPHQWEAINLRPGNYVTVRGGGIAATVIRFFTRAPVAHAYVYVGPRPDGHDMVEAEPGGVRFGNTTDYAHETSWPSRWRLTDEQSERMRKTAIGLAEAPHPYAWLDDLYLGLREGLHLPLPRILFRWATLGKHEECAQLADAVGISAGVAYFQDGRLPGEVSPADLWRLDYA